MPVFLAAALLPSKYRDAVAKKCEIIGEDDLLDMIRKSAEGRGKGRDESAAAASASAASDASPHGAVPPPREPPRAGSGGSGKKRKADAGGVSSGACGAKMASASAEVTLAPMLWADKHKPKHTRDILGNQKAVESIVRWLQVSREGWPTIACWTQLRQVARRSQTVSRALAVSRRSGSTGRRCTSASRSPLPSGPRSTRVRGPCSSPVRPALASLPALLWW